MKEMIERCIQYIEQHIEENLTVEFIAKKMGYSKHHFSRVFSGHVGVTLRDYVIAKRLMQSVRDISNGVKIIDVALKYGYETHSGFTKAFKRHFSYSPSLLIALSITEKILNSEGGNTMTHQELYNTLILKIGSNCSVDQMNLLDRAYKFAVEAHMGKKRYSGEDYVTHPIQVSILLAEMEVPLETVILGLLHDCNEHDSWIGIEELGNEFGEDYYQKVKRINNLDVSENLLNAVNLDADEDIVLVKLADRLHNMKTLKFLDQSRWEIKAKETMAFFSPLAEKFGAIELKAKLDSLSMQITQI